MKQQLETGDTIISLTEQSDNEWQLIKEDNSIIYFDYGVWANHEDTRLALYSHGHGVATVPVKNISKSSREFLESQIIL